MRKLFCLLLCALLLTTAGCATEEEFIDEDFAPVTTTETKVEKAADFGDAIALMMKTFDNSFTQEDLYNMYPQRCWDWFKEKTGKTPEDIYTIFTDRMTENWRKTVEEVGEGATVKYELMRRTDLSAESQEDIRTNLNTKYGIEPETVGTCYKVTIKKATVGELREDIVQQQYHVFEIDGTWYVYEVLMNMPVV